MEKLYVMDNRGMEKEAYKVRYINFENNNYFIYTLNEIDSEGYVKLYLKKINNGEDTGLTALEWEGIKASIPLIVKEIKNNSDASIITKIPKKNNNMMLNLDLLGTKAYSILNSSISPYDDYLKSPYYI